MVDLATEFSNIRLILRDRFSKHFNTAQLTEGPQPITIQSSLNLINGHTLSLDEYVILLLALAPHIEPGLIDSAVQEFLPNGGEFPEFGGVKSGNYRGMFPTGETIVFLLAGNDLNRRLAIQELFLEEHFFHKEGILRLEDVKEGEPKLSGRILVSNEWIDQWLFGISVKPKFSPEFPAKIVETKMNWEDAVLHPHTRHNISIISAWLAHNTELLKDEILGRKIKPGYRVLFFGPSGTGKTLTASLIGKEFGLDVYRIDLSQIVSKYIGETEKNLEKVFSKAENKNWVLFFDEADALFGKRTGVQSSHDKYANQEVSYLLQRVEDFPGLLILASNFKNNIDTAFMRRFHQIIHFPLPGPDDRLKLWEKSLPKNLKLSQTTDLIQIANKYEITGAAILNVVQYAGLQAIARKDYELKSNDIIDGIRRELQKEEKS
ncbi:MAG TPA: ATP-binding protein [Bacteroidia bacterium]|nr:ATP-binding protein [Bacteroidia bacterium]